MAQQSIKAIVGQSENAHEHLSINIDGALLDEIIDGYYPGKSFKGLVPTFLDWLEDKKERNLVWDRISAISEKPTNIPVLMCPDDLDLWCTVIIAEVIKTKDSVKWLRLGINKGTGKNMPESIGTTIEWLYKIPPFEFKIDEFDKCISEFREQVDQDEIILLIQSWINRIDSNESIPKQIKAFNFGLFEAEEEFKAYLIGAKNYDKDGDDWACIEDFVPKEKYLGLTELSKKWTWLELQEIVKTGIEEFIERQLSPKTFVHTAEFLTTGFDDGELHQIVQKNNEQKNEQKNLSAEIKKQSYQEAYTNDHDINDMIEILQIVREKINIGTNLSNSEFDSYIELQKSIDDDLENLRKNNTEHFDRIYFRFLPTAEFQELSIDNGWADEFIELATRFDNSYNEWQKLHSTKIEPQKGFIARFYSLFQRKNK